MVYFINALHDLISLIPVNPQQRVLEIGMEGGDTLVHIKQQKLAAEVVGIDLMELPVSNQRNPMIESVYFLDLDKENLPFSENYFDVIIAGDVLEHLLNPWDVISKLSKVLNVGGTLIISIPNIRDYVALYSIVIKGSFGYTNQGIFDKTHKRFFCKKNMIQLIESDQHLKIQQVIPIQFIGDQNRKRKLFTRFTLGLFEEFTTAQYIFKTEKRY